MIIMLIVIATMLKIPVQAQEYPDPFKIRNIDQFLNGCPNNDPLYPKIREDFIIRRNGQLVDDIHCSEPLSQMPLTEFTDELISVQALRAIYYMDFGRNGHIPWASGTLYDWMKSKIRGIHISDSATVPYCCDYFDDGAYIATPPFNGDLDWYTDWYWMSGKIGLYAHEVRHIDGFYHVSCCGISGGCDQTYDENNLSAYGIQRWLHWAWLTGHINIGLSCLSPDRTQYLTSQHMSNGNAYIERFCDNPPPELTMPEIPGGFCPNNCMGDFESDGDVDGKDIISYISDQTGISLSDFSRYFGSDVCNFIECIKNEQYSLLGSVNIQDSNSESQTFISTCSSIQYIEVAIRTINNYGDDLLTMSLTIDGSSYTAARFVNQGFEGWLRFYFSEYGIYFKPGKSGKITLQDTGKITFGWDYSPDTYDDGFRMQLDTPDYSKDHLFKIF